MVKIQRTLPAPASLAVEADKPSGSYREPDVIEQLRKDFHDKCYLCGIKKLQDPEVEHLLPHKNGKYPERKFDWNNLFLSCGHCNSIKNQTKYDGGILDCCAQDPEEVIDFRFQEGNVDVVAKEGADEKAQLTVVLLQEVFNKKNTGMRVYKCETRLRELNKEMNVLYDKLEELKERPDSRIALRTLKALLRRESAFAAFKRYYIREHKEQFPQLLDF